MAIRKARDSSFKAIFGEQELFAELLRDFSGLEIFKDIKAEDIEDISERFTPLDQEGRDSDTVKRIKLKNGAPPLFVIAIAEHQSEVCYDAAFRMFRYTALVLDAYEKDVAQAKALDPTVLASTAKAFKYPPVLPMIYFDGPGKWTAEMNFRDKTALNDVFGKYIPSFEYVVINLNEISEEDLYRFGDTLSLVLLIDKIRGPKDMRLLKNIPQDYIERFSKNFPDDLKQLLSNVVGTLMRRVNVPPDTIEDITNKIHERRVSKMFDLIEEWDVQEIKRQAQKEYREKYREKYQKEYREKYQKKIQKAQKEILEKAREEAQKAREEVQEKAQKEAQKALEKAREKAREEVREEAQNAQKEARNEITTKAAQIVEQNLLKLGASQDMLDQVLQSLRTQLHEA
jgi:hypothetical protein